MSGAATVSDECKDVVAVHLNCISCGRVEVVHVFQERKLPGAMYWECLECQERRSREGGWPEASVHR